MSGLDIRTAAAIRPLLIKAAQSGLRLRWSQGRFLLGDEPRSIAEVQEILAALPDPAPAARAQPQPQAKPGRRPLSELGFDRGMVECNRCFGSGVVDYRHVEGGVCFACRGSGQISRAAAEKYMSRVARAS